jgi:hypothetical protein
LTHWAAVIGLPPLRISELDRMTRAEAACLMPRSFALRYRAVPTRRVALQLIVFVAEPMDAGVAARFALTYGLTLRLVAAPQFVVDGLLNWLFDGPVDGASRHLIARLLPRFAAPRVAPPPAASTSEVAGAEEGARPPTLGGLRAALLAAESAAVMVEVVRGFLDACCGRSAVWRVRSGCLEPWDSARDPVFGGPWSNRPEQLAPALGLGALAITVQLQDRPVLVVAAGPAVGVITPRQRGHLIGAADALDQALHGAWSHSTG